MRYPEDLFKVQREMLGAYHVLDPKNFYEGNDKWDVPEDPSSSIRKQPPYRLSVATKSGETPDFSLTSVFVPQRKQNLAAFMSVGADAAKPDSYGKFQILRLPDTTQVPGPSQIANQFSNDPKVANQLRAFKQADAKVAYGNLLTLPVGGGLLYVQPLYTLREGGSGNYPVLRFVLSSFGRDVGIGSTLRESLADVLRGLRRRADDADPDGSLRNGDTGAGRHAGPPGRRRCDCCSRPTRSSPRPTRRSRPATSRATPRRSTRPGPWWSGRSPRRSSRSGVDATVAQLDVADAGRPAEAAYLLVHQRAAASRVCLAVSRSPTGELTRLRAAATAPTQPGHVDVPLALGDALDERLAAGLDRGGPAQRVGERGDHLAEGA